MTHKIGFIINTQIHPNTAGLFPWEVRTPTKSLAYGEELTYQEAHAAARSALASAELAHYWDAVAERMIAIGGAS